MRKLLPKSFRFSWKITSICVVLALVMIRCAVWQWSRYHEKQALVETYESHSTAAALPFEPHAIASLINRKVHLSGAYDYEHQLIVTNKKHATGPGHHLFTPLHLETGKTILVSRGFIPYGDDNPETWKKYSFSVNDSFDAVLKKSIPPKFLGPKSAGSGGKALKHRWFFEDLESMASQFPYPILKGAYAQRIGGPPEGQFPAQAISIEVPPSTHFWYTFEWYGLALLTIFIGFVLQAFPWYLRSSPSRELYADTDSETKNSAQ